MTKATQAYITELQDALRLVLMYHDEGAIWGEWKKAHLKQWKRITNEGDATTKVMCDHIRKVLGEPAQ